MELGLFVFAGTAGRPGKVIGSALHNSINNGTQSAAEVYEQQRIMRNPNPSSGPSNPLPSGSLYPRRNPSFKTERGSADRIEKPPYMAGKVTAALEGPSGHW